MLFVKLLCSWLSLALKSRQAVQHFSIVVVQTCAGESVPESERTSEKEFFAGDALSASSSTHNLPSIAQSVLGATAAARGGVSDDERLTWEEERQKLYLQLDDKVSQTLAAVNLYTSFSDKRPCCMTSQFCQKMKITFFFS